MSTCTVRRLAIAFCFICLCLGSAAPVACGQFTPAAVPDAFFGAQRGRVVYHPSGGWRMRYGRGLTPQGAQFLTTVAETFIPLIPQLVNPVAGAEQAAEEAAAALVADPVLDRLRSPIFHSQRIAALDSMLQRSQQLAVAFGQEAYVPDGLDPTTGRSDARVVRLRVAKGRSVSITADQVRQILDNASTFLSADADAPVQIRFELANSGEIVNYSDPGNVVGSVVDKQSEMDALRSQNGDVDVLIVESLDFCGKYEPGTIGCAELGKRNVQIVVEHFADLDLAAVLWAHELCHNGGSDHRLGSLNLMNPTLGPENRDINLAERSSFHRLDPAASPAVAAAAVELAAVEFPASAYENVLDLARLRFVEGIPWDAFRKRYESPDLAPGPAGIDVPDPAQDEIDLLVQLIRDPDEAEHWPTAIALLCATGRQDALRMVMNVVSNLEKKVAGTDDESFYLPELDALKSGYFYLGAIANEKNYEYVGAQLAMDIGDDETIDVPTFIHDQLSARLATTGELAAKLVTADDLPAQAAMDLSKERAESVNTAAAVALALTARESLFNDFQLRRTRDAAALPRDAILDTDRSEAANYARGVLNDIQRAGSYRSLTRER